MNRNTTLKLGLLFFLYAATVSVFVQFILLPYVFPAWNAGDGLLNSSLDSISFHRAAVDLAARIRLQGWSAWSLRPQGQAPIGIASAIYALTIPELWTLIPLNAFLHAVSALFILKIIMFFLPDWKRAVWCVLPFVVYPSAAAWYAQLHKDGYSILGSLLLIYGLMALTKEVMSPGRGHAAWKSLLLVFLGSWLTWIIRPYLFSFIKVTSSLLAGLFGLGLARGFIKRRIRLGAYLERSVIILLLFMMPLAGRLAEKIRPLFPDRKADSPWLGLGQKGIAETSAAVGRPAAMPLGIITRIASMRAGFAGANVNAKSAVDNDVVFTSLKDIVLYLPRTVQIVFFAPFPEEWGKEGSYESNTLMRRVVGVEMLGVYFALCFLPIAAYFWSRHLEFWVAMFYCLGLLVLQGLVVNNIGTLYRMRYGLLMLVVALGLAGFIRFLEVRQDACAE